MAVLTSDDLVLLRRAVASGEHPSWTKGEINSVFQAVEDTLDVLGFEASTFISEVVTTNSEAKTVQDAVTAGTISVDILPVIKGWLQDNPPSVIVRSMNVRAIGDWVNVNKSRFTITVPPDVQAKVLRLMIERRVKAVV